VGKLVEAQYGASRTHAIGTLPRKFSTDPRIFWFFLTTQINTQHSLIGLRAKSVGEQAH
jgi:hypothetical protein